MLYKKDYHLKVVKDEVKFGWDDASGTIQELQETKVDGDLIWKVLNNDNHKEILWMR